LDAATVQRVLNLVGLGIRARNVVVGVEQVRLAARKGRLALALVAPDASANSLKKLLPLLKATKVPLLEELTAESLGTAAGRESTAAIGITDPSLAAGIRKVFDERHALKR
jgi:ribosomal protein L7Ae-like RNA K-turn-binding protein